jgi:transcriptional regulator with XRE-family HTH domain
MRRHAATKAGRLTAEQAFGQVLRTIRQSRGLSQEALGFESGYHRTYISLLERGVNSPSLATILELATALNVRGSEIVDQVEALTALNPGPGRRRLQS